MIPLCWICGNKTAPNTVNLYIQRGANRVFAIDARECDYHYYMEPEDRIKLIRKKFTHLSIPYIIEESIDEEGS